MITPRVARGVGESGFDGVLLQGNIGRVALAGAGQSEENDFVEGRRLRREILVHRYERCIVKGLAFRLSVQGVSSCDENLYVERAL